MVERAAAWLAERGALFAGDRPVLVHGDAHFNNVLWHPDHGATLIDFEVATRLAPDRELEAIVDMILYPAEYAARQEQVTGGDFAEVIETLRAACPSMFVQDGGERMRVYFVMRALLQCHHFAPGSERDPRGRLSGLLDGTFTLPHLPAAS